MKRESIIVDNLGGDLALSGYALRYSSGYEYRFSGLTLEPGSRVAVVSQGTGGDSVAESDPPVYYRDADLPELVLEDGEETVKLLDREREVVSEASYESS